MDLMIRNVNSLTELYNLIDYYSDLFTSFILSHGLDTDHDSNIFDELLYKKLIEKEISSPVYYNIRSGKRTAYELQISSKNIILSENRIRIKINRAVKEIPNLVLSLAYMDKSGIPILLTHKDSLQFLQKYSDIFNYYKITYTCVSIDRCVDAYTTASVRIDRNYTSLTSIFIKDIVIDKRKRKRNFLNKRYVELINILTNAANLSKDLTLFIVQKVKPMLKNIAARSISKDLLPARIYITIPTRYINLADTARLIKHETLQHIKKKGLDGLIDMWISYYVDTIYVYFEGRITENRRVTMSMFIYPLRSIFI